MIATMGLAQAQTAAPSPTHFLAGLGVSAGGDDLATAKFTNGGSQDIKAGGGFYFTTGVDYRVSPDFALQATVNFHVDDTNAKNGNIKFQRFPIELLAYYNLNSQWRVGGGLRYTTSPKLSSGGAAAGLDIKFDDTTSGVLEAEYFWTPAIGMKMRYVNETFKARGYHDVKANHVGISGNFYF